MNKQLWIFTAFDTLFFKESRPIESIGGSQLNSVFPPPAKTLIGAIRTTIGNEKKVDWHAYSSDQNHDLRKIIGDSENLHPLHFCGPYLLHAGERLFPVPLIHLATHSHGSPEQQTRLVPSTEWVDCDLGKVKMPVKQNTDLTGAKPFPTSFMTAKGLQEFLSGNAITEPLQHQDEFFLSEQRLGIARDSNTRTASNGMLYQTSHIRPHQKVQIGITLSGLQELPELPLQGVTRLGAEGRIASWKRLKAEDSPTIELPAITKPKNAKGLVLVLLTPALFSNGWCPENFEAATSPNGQQYWTGYIKEFALHIECSVIGKPIREGGWNMAAKAPRPLASYVPAGSCYFCTLNNGTDLEAAQKALHGIQIGNEQEYGRGQLAVGYW